MIGTKFYKSGFSEEEYEAAAAWCNDHGATIEEKEEWYEVVTLPEPSAEEVAAAERAQRRAELQSQLAALSYVSEEIALGLATRDDYADEIETIASIHNQLAMLDEDL